MKYLKKACSITLSAAMVMSMAGIPATVSYAAGNIEKEETVYVTQNAEGTIDTVTVSNWLKNVTGTQNISDVSNLKNIKNVKGDETFTQGSNGALTWKADNADIYYQGTSNEKPPVNVKISYELDGKTVLPDKLAGKSGKLTIKIHYENNASYKDKIDGKNTDLKTPFLMASALILPVDTFTDVTVSQGKLVSEGSNQIVVAYGMPGLSKSLNLSEDMRDEMDKKLGDTVTITANVTDFSIGSIYTVATSNEFSDIELDDESDIHDVEDAINGLADATDDLISGSSDLSDGLTTLQNHFKTYASGVNDVKKGAADLSTGAGKLSKGVSKYTAGVTSLTDGTSQFVTGTNSLSSGITAYIDGEKQIDAGVTQLYKKAGELSKYSEFSGKLEEYVGAVNQLAGGVQNAGGNLSGIGDALTGYGNAAQVLDNAKMDLSGSEQLKAAIQDSDLDEASKNALNQLLNDAAKSNATVSQAQAAINGINEKMQQSLGSTKLPDTKDTNTLIQSGSSLINASSQFNQGIQKLNDSKEGIPALYAGVKELSKNNDALLKGASELTKKSSILTSGINTLNKNSKTLTDSAKELSNGASTLSKGAGKLNGATADVSSGVDKLQSGSVDLLNGMNEFKTDGTGKLQNKYNNNIKTVIDRFQSLTREANDYKTFSGIADNMDGTVKFIFQTAEIKSEKE